MPIQFRCQNCSQLLGISRSKAGSVVDCPACGRSLRVPVVDGTVADPASVQRSSAESTLRNALEELSNLPTTAGTATRQPPGRPIVSRPRIPPLNSAGNDVDTQKNTLRIVPLSSVTPVSRSSAHDNAGRDLAEIPADDDSGPLVIPELCDPEVIEEPAIPAKRRTVNPALVGSEPETAFALPNRLSTALEELAEFAPQNPPPEHAFAVSPSPSRNWLTIVAVTALVAFAAGYAVARLQRSSDADSAPVRNEVSPEEAILPALDKVTGPNQSVTGKITLSDGSGEPDPDSEALVLLLPSVNASGLKLDARPLRDLHATPAKEAVEAALRVLGATITRAADDGTYSLERRHSGPAKLIVVSRHSSRPDSEAIPPSVAASLAEWFESPSHLTGRLSVQEKVLSAENDDSSCPPVDINFKK